jgi:hypothetical protein
MPIPTPEERPNLYDAMDCRPGPSAYPAADAARSREILYERLIKNPKLKHLAERLRSVAEVAE